MELPLKRNTRKDPEMQKPATAPWGLSISNSDFQKLTAGYKPRGMDDRWRVAVSPPDQNGTISVHFARSWTGIPHYVLFIKPIDGDSSDAIIDAITWEQNKGGIYISEEMAKMTVVTISRSFLECDYDLLPEYDTDKLL
ncbi:hypothetical protein ASPVEDRAFT_155399 [Aspergillus versicolor CBS 583.65]|uniref:Uncharacterized protein n=1 Tax=Aspergillus versicolor CBS 583.65 TaxID=1036611 RepID=A0A1L9Q1I5_ASPVE|nr:uncharacterized protein ASPVEDRAFT_155399 [Aspergillus versicolor CBS 583.65]OJJ07576.1 hypothetical protein ASPVEDRAFT_155399 [Aspergillus versicolor CBS 583.65]